MRRRLSESPFTGMHGLALKNCLAFPELQCSELLAWSGPGDFTTQQRQASAVKQRTCWQRWLQPACSLDRVHTMRS